MPDIEDVPPKRGSGSDRRYFTGVLWRTGGLANSFLQGSVSPYNRQVNVPALAAVLAPQISLQSAIGNELGLGIS